MNTIILHELKRNLKSFIIWTVSLAVFCGGCIFIFPMFKDSMEEMAAGYANIEGFSKMFGLDKLSMASLNGFFATEIGTMYSLGATMFAALLAIGIFSKEEASHTAEFLHTLPFGRTCIINGKIMSVLCLGILFDLIQWGTYALCILCIGEEFTWHYLTMYMLLNLLLHLEIACICLLISVCTKKMQFGAGIGLTLVFYILDLISRITDKTENLKYLTPFYYANASNIFSGNNVEKTLVYIGIGISVLCLILVYGIYEKRDLAA